MKDLKEELKELIVETMIPESKAFLEELNEELKNGTDDDDINEAIEDMESFLIELQSILSAIEENKMSDDEIKMVHKKIVDMLDEHEGED